MARSFYRPHKRVQFTGQLFDHKTGEFITPPSLTKQSFVAECDINNIIKQFRPGGIVSHISAKAAMGAYMDLPDPVDFQEAMNIALAGQSAFESLPAKVRDRFSNDPEKFLAFMADKSNTDEARSLGLLNPLAPPPPSPVSPPTSSSEAPPSTSEASSQVAPPSASTA